jgi:hypothetical protein
MIRDQLKEKLQRLLSENKKISSNKYSKRISVTTTALRTPVNEKIKMTVRSKKPSPAKGIKESGVKFTEVIQKRSP